MILQPQPVVLLKNKENCKKISKRCHAILSILTECAQAYQRNGNISKGQEDGLNDLSDALEDLHTTCEKYIGLGKVRRMMELINLKNTNRLIARSLKQ